MYRNANFLNSSNENGYEKGLEIIDGTVELIKNVKSLANFTLPHIGWNSVKYKNRIKYLEGLKITRIFIF